MKKLLLLISLVTLGLGSAFATTDGVTYDEVNGIKIANQWTFDRSHNLAEYSAMPYCNTYARTACISNGYVYIAHSNALTVIQGTDTLTQSVVYKLDAKDGSLVATLPLTLDGAVYGGAVLSANNIGADHFGHLWLAPYSSELATVQPIYQLDGETGALTHVADLEKDQLSRCDYLDLMGDITRKEAECNIMTVSASDAFVYRWHADQGEDFAGGFDGDTYLAIINFFPLATTNFGYGPVVKMVLGDDEETKYSGNLFYIDGFGTAPVLYDLTGSLVDSFESVEDDLQPWDLGANGVCEFTLDGRNFIVYTIAQYTGTDEKTMKHLACQAFICEMGEGMTLAGMKKYWMVPDAFGTTSDGGTRVESLSVEYGTDSEGNDYVNLLVFKCYNGVALYKIGKNVEGGGSSFATGDVNGDADINIADVNALISIILGNSTESDYAGEADVNGDADINIADVNAVIAIILGN